MVGFGLRPRRWASTFALAWFGAFSAADPAAAHPELDEWFSDLAAFEVHVELDETQAGPTIVRLVLPDREVVLELAPSTMAAKAGLVAVTESGAREAASDVILLRGRIVDRADSSAAVSILAGTVQATIRDGSELLLIEAPLDGIGKAWIGANPFAGPAMLAPSPGEVTVAASLHLLEVALIADHEFFLKHGTGTTAKMLAVLNLVDAIFRDQLDLSFDVTATMVHEAAEDPFTNFTSTNLFNNYRDATTQFGNWRAAQGGAIQGAGIAHLFSDRNLNVPPGGKINAGFGFIDTLCDEDRGVSISTAPSIPDSFHAGVVAHEFGHNFGARHDGEAPCASVPAGDFIMEQGVVSTVFSPCTLGIIVAGRDDAACISVESTTTTTTTSTTTTTLATPLCGDFNGDGSLKAPDALGVLRAAVGSIACEKCICDTDASGSIAAGDALRVLRAAVGLDIEINCPAC